MSAETVQVELGDRSYPVRIGAGLRHEALAVADRRLAAGQRCAALTSPGVAAAQPAFVAELAQRMPVLVTAADGETAKSAGELARAWDFLAAQGIARDSAVFALGGGVIGDLAGFAAASYQRGVAFYQLPTTLLAMVDSSVGGKTGVNTPEGKNLLGAFHQPQLVLADTETLATLHEREFNEGFAEIIKHAAIRDASLLGLVEDRAAVREHLVTLVARNVAIKAAVVEEDERETTGTRALLNFGHTLGHGIEAAGGYGRFLHGEAISLGLVAATRLSVEKSGLSPAAGERILHALEAYELPTVLADDIPDEAILAAMGRDKKFEAGQIRFVLLKSLGEAYVSDAVSQEDLLRALAALRT